MFLDRNGTGACIVSRDQIYLMVFIVNFCVVCLCHYYFDVILFFFFFSFNIILFFSFVRFYMIFFLFNLLFFLLLFFCFFLLLCDYLLLILFRSCFSVLARIMIILFSVFVQCDRYRFYLWLLFVYFCCFW